LNRIGRRVAIKTPVDPSATEPEIQSKDGAPSLRGPDRSPSDQRQIVAGGPQLRIRDPVGAVENALGITVRHPAEEMTDSPDRHFASRKPGKQRIGDGETVENMNIGSAGVAAHSHRHLHLELQGVPIKCGGLLGQTVFQLHKLSLLSGPEQGGSSPGHPLLVYDAGGKQHPLPPRPILIVVRTDLDRVVRVQHREHEHRRCSYQHPTRPASPLHQHCHRQDKRIGKETP